MHPWRKRRYHRAVTAAVTAALAALAALGGGPAVAAERPVADGANRVHRFRLENDVTALLVPVDRSPAVAVQAWVGAGSADDPPSRAGMAHVFEHMLFKRTATRGAGDLAGAIEAVGGDVNAWTAFDHTVLHAVVPGAALDTATAALGEALSAPSFDADELERERAVILEELRQVEDDPGRAVAQALLSTIFARHPYRQPVIGRADTIGRIGRRDLVAFHRARYRGGNVTVVIAGDVDPRRFERVVTRDFGRLPAGEVDRPRRREPRQTAPRSSVSARDVAEVYLALGFAIPPLASGATALLDLAAIALGQGASSRLSRRTRRGGSFVTGASAAAHALRDAGLLSVGATAVPGRAREAVRAAAEETFRLAREEVSAGELDRARQAILAGSVYRRETVEGLATDVGTFESLAGDARLEDAYLEAVRAATPSAVRDAAARHLDPRAASVAAILPTARGTSRPRGLAAEKRRLLGDVDRGAALAVRGLVVPAALRGDPDLATDVLPNGMRVVVVRERSVPVVAVRAAWSGGLRLETPATGGIHHVLARVLTRGCGPRGPEDMVRELDDMAATLAGFSSRDGFGVHGEWLARDWERGFELLADCLLAPQLDDGVIHRERRSATGDLLARRDDASRAAFRLFTRTLFDNHPYRLDPLGTPGSLGRLSRKRLASHYRRYYPISAMTLAVVGDVDPARVISDVRARFSRVPARKRPERSIPEARFEGRPAADREVYHFLDRRQAHLVVGFPGTTHGDPDRYALEVLATVLGGQSGRLFAELRDRRGLAYRLGMVSVEGVDPGYIAVFLACSPDKLDAALEGVRAELRRVKDEGVSGEELQRAVRYLVGTHEIARQRRASRAAGIALHEAYGVGYREYRRYGERIEAVTAADVQRAAREYLDRDTAVIATVVPPHPTPGARRRGAGRGRGSARGAR